jgi:(1->4)-alpha-D-glucan 1-alpha-D-glucosylmutase
VNEVLERLARAAGIAPSFRDYFGNETYVSDATKAALLDAMGYDVSSEASIHSGLDGIEKGESRAIPEVSVVPAGASFELACLTPVRGAEWRVALEDGGVLEGRADGLESGRLRIEMPLPLGYHRFTLRHSGLETSGALIAVPPACYVLPDMEGGRVWALATQLYALRSERNWGIGDLGDLRDLAALSAQAGAGALAVNPLHELFPSNPWAASPYAPSSRLFLNIFYLDVPAIPDFAESPAARDLAASHDFTRDLRRVRASDLVDYEGVAKLKLEVLALLFEAFRVNHLERPGGLRAPSFRAFVRAGGRALERLGRYEALAEHFRARDSQCYGWLQWPKTYQSPESPEVLAFARAHAGRVDFYCYLQWLADEQLAQAASSARALGVHVYRDLAVGVDRNGADAWSDRGALASGAALGAPADPMNTHGQNWGLPPLSPRALRERAFAPFVALLRANMRHAGILRIDHVMALQRAFWIPQGHPATEGAYVRYPLDEMLGILALESMRNRCAVVGEDLGTVPDGFRERLQSASVLSSRLVYFEREADGSFRSPRAYPRLAAASIGTHDLPPLLGWWLGAGDERAHERRMLVDALEREDCVDAGGAARLREDAAAGGTHGVAELLSAAVHRFLAFAPSMLDIVAIEDVLGEADGVNVPGTTDEHPNWQRKRQLPLEAFANDGRLVRIGAVMRDANLRSQRTVEA